jgi:hypothetical protein
MLGRDVGGVEDRADPGEHRAAEQRRELERQVGGDRDRQSPAARS